MITLHLDLEESGPLFGTDQASNIVFSIFASESLELTGTYEQWEEFAVELKRMLYSRRGITPLPGMKPSSKETPSRVKELT